MEDLELDNNGTINTEVDALPESTDANPEIEETELTDEELALEVERLKEEAKNQEDPKEKRHLEQQAGWSQKILKERDKAKALEQENNRTKETMSAYESSLLEEVYEKAIDEKFGLDYFENFYKTNPSLADKLATEKWGKSAKNIILETKRDLAKDGNESAKEEVSKEDIRAQVYHEVAIEQAQTIFDDLTDSEKSKAIEYFNDMVEWKTLTPVKAKQFAEMAKIYVTKDRKLSESDKEKVLAGKAATNIASKSGVSKQEENIDVIGIRQQLMQSGLSEYQVNLMYPLK